MSLCSRLQLINLYQCAPGFFTNERIFDYQYLLYVHKGTGIFKIGNTPYTGAMGDIFFCPDGISNTIIADKEDPFLLSGIEFRMSEPFQSETKGSKLLPKISLLHSPNCVNLIMQMIDEGAYSKIFAGEISDVLMSALYLQLLRISQIGAHDEGNVALRILDYVKAHFEEEITYQELSERFAYHKSSINRLMKAVTGMSLREYQIDLRLKTAMELLAYSKRPQGEIAALCGYNSAIFFSRQFKEKIGCTPSAYRQAKQDHGTDFR